MKLSLNPDSARLNPRFIGTLNAGFVAIDDPRKPSASLYLQAKMLWQLGQGFGLYGAFDYNFRGPGYPVHNTTIGSYTRLFSSTRLKKKRVYFHPHGPDASPVLTFVKVPLQIQRSVELYSAYSFRYIASQVRFDEALWEDLIRQDERFSSSSEFLNVRTVDLGLSITTQRNYRYEINDLPGWQFKRFRNTFKVLIPVEQRVDADLYLLSFASGSAEFAERSYEDFDILNDQLRATGFAIDMEYLTARTISYKNYILTTFGVETGYYPFFEGESLFVQLKFGVGLLSRS